MSMPHGSFFFPQRLPKVDLAVHFIAKLLFQAECTFSRVQRSDLSRGNLEQGECEPSVDGMCIVQSCFNTRSQASIATAG